MLVNEIFRSIQGEGPGAGQEAVFLRLSGCNLRCTKCDTAYAFDEGTEMDVLAVIARLKELRADEIKYVVVTGGEPLLQFEELNRVVVNSPRFIQFGIETNGTIYEILDNRRSVHYIVSPKGIGSFGDVKGRKLYDKFWGSAAVSGAPVTFKFVVGYKSDVNSVMAFVKEQNIPIGNVWIMPECTTKEEHFERWPDVFEWALEYGFNATPRLHTMAFGMRRGI